MYLYFLVAEQLYISSCLSVCPKFVSKILSQICPRFLNEALQLLLDSGLFICGSVARCSHLLIYHIFFQLKFQSLILFLKLANTKYKCFCQLFTESKICQLLFPLGLAIGTDHLQTGTEQQRCN